MPDSTLEERAIAYAKLCGIALDLKTPLGHGTDGSVWRSDRKTAVKALYRQHNYSLESECYQRFAKHKVTNIRGFSVPELIGLNDDLWIVEMRIVTPPFILDFAKVTLDRPPDFSPEVLEEWEQECQERFEDHWPEVQTLLWALKRYGIHYLDAKPANIMFGD